ncbi:MAG: hypothetical protein E6G50_05565 [Actinobacteria bacterium]|nr:MAG: hypothetical protein E6G50_05565 [Actinomycetota bacterium]
MPPGLINADFGPPVIARSCAIAPVFLIWNATGPAFSAVVARMILNSFSVTSTTCGAAAGFGFGAAVVVGFGFAALLPVTLTFRSMPAALWPGTEQ